MKLVVLRGCSGSGKSTKARELAKEFMDQNTNGTTHICSADDWFVNQETGKYEFNPKWLTKAHAWCNGQAYAAMSLKTDLVILDNTSTQKWEYQPYLDLAQHFGYETEEIIVGQFDDDSLLLYAERNSHGVPLEVIKKMAARFEK